MPTQTVSLQLAQLLHPSTSCSLFVQSIRCPIDTFTLLPTVEACFSNTPTMRSLLFFPFLALALLLPLHRSEAANAVYRNEVLADNPLAYWQLDEAVGATTSTDGAGTPQNGTYQNVTLGVTSAFPNLGTCGTFNGSSSRVVVPFDSSFNLGSGTYSVECWFKITTTARGDVFNFKSGSGDFGIFANDGGTGNIGGYHNGYFPVYNTTVNAWHYVVVTRSGTTLSIYVDGQLRSTATDAQAMSSSADIVLGANQTQLYFTGQIDEVAYYNTALSAARVLAHYTAAQQTATAPPTVVNAAVTNLYATSATLGATVTNTGGGDSPNVTIFYGSTDGGTNAAAWTGILPLGPQAGAASGNISGLTQGSTYYYRARAVNVIGTAWAASSATFATPVATPPAVQNLAPTNISGTSANLRGEVTAIGNQPPAVTIYYGTADGGTTPAAWAQSVSVPGTQAGAFFQTVAGLSPTTTYYYRNFAQNLGGSAWAPASQSFTTPVYVPPTVVINELHIAEDDPTIHSEFIELYNASATPADLSGWYFDKGINFTLPVGTTLAAGGYLVLCEDPATISSRYSVSGAGVLSWQDSAPAQYASLSNNGERVTLRDANGNKIDEVEYGLGFPWPTVGDVPSKSMELINPSLDNNLGGSWRSSTASGPTPRRANSVFATNAPPAIRQVDQAPVTPVAGQTWMTTGQPVRVTAKVTDPDGVQSVALQYQIVEPGDYIKDDDARYNNAASWTTVAMHDDGQNGDLILADDVFSGIIPGTVQTHRRLIRYRITVTDILGTSVRVPYADDPQPNFAYFVYDAVPAWTGSKQPGFAPNVTYPSATLSALQQYHLITRVEEHSSAQYVPVVTATGSSVVPTAGAYTHSLYNWKGALCFNGVVYDHIRYRARGGVWRFSMGKNMWKFDFNKGHDFAARDNYGREYDQKWKKLNFSSIIQQGDFGSRGEQGLYEAVGFRLFQLTGMPAENTQYVHFRIIERPSETNGTASQYDDDFQGVYLGIEQQDGQFLDAHGLPDGNLYKLEGGTGELNHQGATLPSNKSDLNAFLNYGTTEQWWRDNVDLPNYYNYRAIIDCIHHYDIGDGKNYFYFHNAVTNKWTALPWDLDLTWNDNAYRGDSGIAGLPPSGNTTEPFFSRVFGNGSSTGIPALQKEHRNRMREVLDLLFTSEQTGMLIDELGSFFYQPGVPNLADADRAMWDYNPILATSYVNASKAGQGRFYQSAVDIPSTPASELNTFPGMMQRMKNYVVTRRNVIISQVLTATEENLVPTTPVITVAGGSSPTIPTNALNFSSSAFSGKNGATFSAMKWRVAESTEPGAAGYQPYNHTNPRYYEADPENTWESPELTAFSTNYNFPPIAAKVGHTYRARVKHRDSNGRWSHWSAPVSFTATAPDINVYLQSLVVSKIMYHPANPSAAEQVVAQSDNAYEWVELLNVGPGPLDLTPVRFTKGVDFDFAGSAVTTLNPGQRVLVVSNLAAFNKRYAGQLAGLQIAGEWESGDNLSDEGEQLKLSYGAGTPIRDFVYGTAAPWPTEGNTGRALILIAPTSLPDHGAGENWRASGVVHGTPGVSDGTSFAAWSAANGFTDPALDEDGDGLNNFGEYCLKGSPTLNSQSQLPQAANQLIDGVNYLTLSYRRNLAADDVRFAVQAGGDLASWSSDSNHVRFVSKTTHGDGTATYVYRTAQPNDGTQRQFMRLFMQAVGN